MSVYTRPCRTHLCITLTVTLKCLFILGVAFAVCYPVNAQPLGTTGATAVGHDRAVSPDEIHTRRHILSTESGCDSPYWLCTGTADLQHRLSNALYAAIQTGQCSQVSTTLGLWRCGTVLVPTDLRELVTNGSCTAECSPQLQRCAARASVGAFPPAPAPSTCLPCMGN